MDSGLKDEVVVIKVPDLPGKRLVFASTGPVNRDYDDIRRFSDAAGNGIKRYSRLTPRSGLHLSKAKCAVVKAPVFFFKCCCEPVVAQSCCSQWLHSFCLFFCFFSRLSSYNLWLFFLALFWFALPLGFVLFFICLSFSLSSPLLFCFLFHLFSLHLSLCVCLSGQWRQVFSVLCWCARLTAATRRAHWWDCWEPCKCSTWSEPYLPLSHSANSCVCHVSNEPY